MTISDIITFDLLSRYDGKIKNWIKALKATTTQDGLMSKEDKATLDGLVSTGGEENQNAFSNVKVGSTTIAADAKTDTLELAAGSSGLVTLTPDTTNDKVTIDVDDDLSNFDNTNAGFITNAALSDLAPKTSPALTGTPTAPTATAGTSTTQIATTAFVATAVSGKANSNDVYTKTQTYTKTETDTAIATALTSAVVYKGSVATYADLPSSGMQNGWLYNVIATDMNYVWNSTSNDWDPQAPTVTIAAATTAQIDSLFT